MPIRSLAQSTPESITGFEAAAEEKYEDGFNLMASPSPGNGVYLMGYVAEMLLKSAYFRLIGLSATATITRTELNQARSAARTLGVAAPEESLHGLEFWGELLIKTRRQGVLMAPLIEAELDKRTKLLAQNWFVEMRYQALQGISLSDVEAVLDDVIWIKSNYEQLWR